MYVIDHLLYVWIWVRILHLDFFFCLFETQRETEKNLFSMAHSLNTPNSLARLQLGARNLIGLPQRWQGPKHLLPPRVHISGKLGWEWGGDFIPGNLMWAVTVYMRIYNCVLYITIYTFKCFLIFIYLRGREVESEVLSVWWFAVTGLGQAAVRTLSSRSSLGWQRDSRTWTSHLLPPRTH